MVLFRVTIIKVTDIKRKRKVCVLVTYILVLHLNNGLVVIIKSKLTEDGEREKRECDV